MAEFSIFAGTKNLGSMDTANEEELSLAEFSSTDKSTWIHRIEKELRTQQWPDLSWQVAPDLSVDAAYHPEDPIAGGVVSPAGRYGQPWLIGESFDQADMTGGQELLQEALRLGLESPAILAASDLLAADWLGSVYTDMASVFWYSGPGDSPATVASVMRAQSTGAGPVKGGYFAPTIVDSDVVGQYTAWLGAFGTGFAGDFRLLCIDETLTRDPEDPVSDIAATALTMIRLLDVFHRSGNLDRSIADRILIRIHTGDHLLAEIARLRALRLVVANILQAYGLDPSGAVFIDAGIAPAAYGPDANYNRIKGGLCGWAMAAGGADRITIRPGQAAPPAEEQGFNRRVARNVHHLLREEGFMDQVTDPAAGSYYLEQFTEKIGTAAWQRMQTALSDPGDTDTAPARTGSLPDLQSF